MKVKALNSAMIQTFDKPLDVVELIRQQPSYESSDDEGLAICNISDVIRKHEVWEQLLPRVRPFFGECLMLNWIHRRFKVWKSRI